ncbi:MAG: hypothetical protein K0S33_1043 [Bacteroidetes bacterium]|jgi:gliding motility-associated-like protein|nr:hypothetical protein [Bacteroidota bacterium]
MKGFLHFFILWVFAVSSLSAQNDVCSGATPICTSLEYQFPSSINSPTAEAGPDYGCLTSQPNPSWYYLQIDNSGSIVMNIFGQGPGDNIDFICWGPFATPTGACAGGLTAANTIDCAANPSATENCTIPNALSGEYYIILVTNQSAVPSHITFYQTNGGLGVGSTNCDIVPCDITRLTASPGPCIGSNNMFTISGIIETTVPPSSGSLTITNSCGGSLTYYPPFSSSTGFSINSPATGGTCTITAVFSADPSCAASTTIAAPVPCNNSPCDFTQLTAVAGACDPVTNMYDINGTISFINPPSTGNLTVSTWGTLQVFNAPFVSPISYSLTNLPANGLNNPITAAFTAATCEETFPFTAPPSCDPCNINITTANGPCYGNNQFDITGTITLTAPPPEGELYVVICDTTMIFTAPFSSPLSFTVTSTATGAPCLLMAFFIDNIGYNSCAYNGMINTPAPCMPPPPPCGITQMTAVAGPCNPLTNTFDVTGIITFHNPPSSGVLAVDGGCGGIQLFYPPFVSPLSYTLSTINITPYNCTVHATFTAYANAPFCNSNAIYIPPAECNPAAPCDITLLEVTPQYCQPYYNTVGLTVSIEYINPPTGGDVLVSIDGAPYTTPLSPPFYSPSSYSGHNIFANGGQHTLSIFFASDPGCIETITFTSPVCFSCGTNGPLCEGETASLYVTDGSSVSPVQGYPVTWTGPNGFTSNDPFPVINNADPLASGTYTATVTFPPDLQVASATTTIIVHPAPVANAGPDTLLCAGSSVPLTGQGTGIYSWTPATTLNDPAITNPVASPLSTTTYTFTVTSVEGCEDSDETTVSVIPFINATVSPDMNICNGSAVQLIASGSLSYSWSPATGLSNAGIPNPMASPSATTNYSVSISGGAGCAPVIKNIQITVHPKPTVQVTPNDTICAGQSGVIYASGAGSYVWQGLSTTDNFILSSPAQTTFYTVIGSTGICSDTANGAIVVSPLPVADFSLSVQNEPGDYVITANSSSSGLLNGYWTINTSDTLILFPLVHDLKSSGTYTVCLHGENERGCMVSECEKIILKDDWTIYIPNSFTPNGDGKNDVFYAYGVNFSAYELLIFDRWGELIYSSADPNEGWKGDIAGTIAKTDTYIYKLKVADPGLQEQSFQGHVHLIR